MSLSYTTILKYYLSNPGEVFSILILGERGTGKTKSVKEIARNILKTDVIVANCASFSDDTMAESELFGYKKGAFTGAHSNKQGLFEEAKGKILFFDEVHTLSKRVQEKLMTALQTESSGPSKGKFSYRRLGENRENHVVFRPVFASNKKVNELRKILLPDFFDRISQLTLKIPSISEDNVSVYEAFTKVWKNMQFEGHNEIPQIKPFKNWLKQINLSGNYRTLETIAINWQQGRLIDELKDESDIFEFVKSHFNEFIDITSDISKSSKFNFRKSVSKKRLELEYELDLIKWALSEEGYGSIEKTAQEGLKSQTRLKSRIKEIEKKLQTSDL